MHSVLLRLLFQEERHGLMAERDGGWVRAGLEGVEVLCCGLGGEREESRVGESRESITVDSSQCRLSSHSSVDSYHEW